MPNFLFFQFELNIIADQDNMQYINLINYINNIVEFNKEEFIFFKSKYKLFGIIFVPSINHYTE